MELHRAGEDYLKAILIIQQKKGSVRSTDIAGMLHVTRPSVSRAVKLLRESGLLTMNADRRICLTQAGQEAAKQVFEKHCVLKACLISMGVDPETAEKEACGMEHVISLETLEQMKRFIGNTEPEAAAL